MRYNKKLMAIPSMLTSVLNAFLLILELKSDCTAMHMCALARGVSSYSHTDATDFPPCCGPESILRQGMPPSSQRCVGEGESVDTNADFNMFIPHAGTFFLVVLKKVW